MKKIKKKWRDVKYVCDYMWRDCPRGTFQVVESIEDEECPTYSWNKNKNWEWASELPMTFRYREDRWVQKENKREWNALMFLASQYHVKFSSVYDQKESLGSFFKAAMAQQKQKFLEERDRQIQQRQHEKQKKVIFDAAVADMQNLPMRSQIVMTKELTPFFLGGQTDRLFRAPRFLDLELNYKKQKTVPREKHKQKTVSRKRQKRIEKFQESWQSVQNVQPTPFKQKILVMVDYEKHEPSDHKHWNRSQKPHTARVHRKKIRDDFLVDAKISKKK
jgi:hypothetical protein